MKNSPDFSHLHADDPRSEVARHLSAELRNFAISLCNPNEKNEKFTIHQMAEDVYNLTLPVYDHV